MHAGSSQVSENDRGNTNKHYFDRDICSLGDVMLFIIAAGAKTYKKRWKFSNMWREREKENCRYSRPIIRNGEHSVFILFSGLPYFDIDNNNSTINENPCIMKTCMNRTSTLRRQCPKYFCSSVRQSVSQTTKSKPSPTKPKCVLCIIHFCG